MSSTARVLPPELHPGPDIIRRRHKPEPGTYGDYRECLRWEFGFICAFCLLHEADIIKHGAEGTGMMWVEHLHPQSTTGKKRKHQYANCYYSCRFCNNRRRNKPLTKGGQRLLDPCADAWANHFDLVNARLNPRTDNADYTEKAYGLNDPRKRKMREHRRDRIPFLLDQVETLPGIILDLMQKMSASRGTDRQKCMRHLRTLRASLDQARRELQTWAITPADRPDSCRCRRARSEKKRIARRRIPKMYADQAVAVPVP